MSDAVNAVKDTKAPPNPVAPRPPSRLPPEERPEAPEVIRFAGVMRTVTWQTYTDGGRIAVGLTDAWGEPVAMLTINIPDVMIALDEVIIDIEGDASAPRLGDLLASGMFADTGRAVRVGDAAYPVYRLLCRVPGSHRRGFNIP